MPSLDTGAMGAMGNAKMSSLAAQFGCGAAGAYGGGEDGDGCRVGQIYVYMYYINIYVDR